VTVAQWTLERNWGSHQSGNNCFGIKEYPGCYAVQMLETEEVIGNLRRKQEVAFAAFSKFAGLL